jgi:hypothetical protein
MQAQHRVVELDVLRQDFLEVGLGHVQRGGVAVSVAVVRATVSVEDRHIAKPNARLHIGQGDLLARYRGRAHAHRTLGAGDPLLGRVAPCRKHVAIFVSFDVSASKYVVT